MQQLQFGRYLSVRHDFIAQFVSWLVGLDGVFLLATSLLDQIAAHHNTHLTNLLVDVPVILGLSLIYVSNYLFRRKRNAWLVAVAIYVVELLLNSAYLLTPLIHQVTALGLTRSIFMPLVIISALLLTRREFTVRSDVGAFRTSVKISVLVLVAMLAYGVTGFLLLDTSDFHQEITVAGAFQRTIDQFDLTTARPLHPYTRRAHLFVDSLTVVSTGAVVYVIISFFQPVRSRFRDQKREREAFGRLLQPGRAVSEDFFKVWPHDKQYYFNRGQTAGLAYQVRRGVALVQGDPIGTPTDCRRLIAAFDSFCRGNDWLPAFVHVDKRYRKQYEARSYTLQRLGQEAIVDLEHFQDNVVRNKYFRNITNRFQRAQFTAEVQVPPHSEALLSRLKIISDEWLARPGRAERGFFMGYFDENYLQQCHILVARDEAGTIQGFMNLIPAPYDREEATYDLLRNSNAAPSNLNDYLLLELIAWLRPQGYERLNMGLSPLVGLDDSDELSGIIDRVMRLIYLNGDRFYSFSGLYRFKDKYEPRWEDRFVAYRGGLRGFSRSMNVLLSAMSKAPKTR